MQSVSQTIESIGPAEPSSIGNVPIKPQNSLTEVLRKTKVVTCRTRRRRGASLLPLSSFSGHFLDVGLVDGQQNVFWFDVGVDDLALGVEVV